jgi:capsular polysaccharide biosynthesis protein
LLRERGGLEEALLPMERTPTMVGSLKMLGLDPDVFRTFDPERTLEVEELTIVQNDRFRPDLVRLVQEAFAVPGAEPPHRKVYVSRGKAARRRLVNEDEVWAILKKSGFERVYMEEMAFEEQVNLMRETAVLAGPHGAGLTNMVFCPAGANVIEIADLSFPNPNFYALASGLRHRYWILKGDTLGNGHPLERDFRIDTSAVEDVLRHRHVS